MKIINEITDIGNYLQITKAEYLSNYMLKLYFNNGKEIKVDFQPFLEGNNHPDIRKYLDIKNFKQFVIIDGNLNWNDYEMIFPVEDLYNALPVPVFNA